MAVCTLALQPARADAPVDPRLRALANTGTDLAPMAAHTGSLRTGGPVGGLFGMTGGSKFTAADLAAAEGPKGPKCKPGTKRYARIHERQRRKVAAFCQPKLTVKYTPLRRYRVACGPRPIKHTPLSRYAGQCNPNPRPLTQVEKLGEELEQLFTFKRRNCDIIDLFSNIAAGEMVETDKYGKALVVDFKVRKRVFQYMKYPDPYALKGKKVTRKYRAIRNLTLKVTEEDPNFPHDKKGYYLVCLNESETKEVIIRNLIVKGKIERLTMVYPEERENLGVWEAKYGTTTEAQLRKLGPQALPQ
ncbi:MAG: hypothetical protein SFY70_04175 [Bacteroidia bacterium]|nr:hypothetical protein [Bacteroidia bacterium]